jgi:hypothetical protein
VATISDWESYDYAKRPGRPRTARQTEIVERVVRITLKEKPKAATHWSTRTLSAYLGISASTVARIWRAHGIKPHRIKSFKLSNDPNFIEKLEDIGGLYLNSPEHTPGPWPRWKRWSRPWGALPAQ